LDKKYVADLAGRSMWNGETGISQVSIGIELVGYRYAPISEKQYQSAGIRNLYISSCHTTISCKFVAPNISVARW
jgi:N-acetyl-anhydromuramyl-L-alanine amidase AmpD